MRSQWFVDDEAVRQVHTQDAEPVFAEVEALREMERGREPMRIAARVPTVLAQEWAREAGVRMYSKEFNEVLKRKLMDGEFSRLRVSGF